MKFNQRSENSISYNFGITNLCIKNQLNGPEQDPILTENYAEETIPWDIYLEFRLSKHHDSYQSGKL